MYSEEIEDFKVEIIKLKRLNHNLKHENTLFKVKIRKLEEDVTKKNKQLDGLLNPKKTDAFRKLISEHGASLIVKLQEEIDCLNKRLSEKDTNLRRLEKDLRSAKVYTANHTKSHSNKKVVKVNKSNDQIVSKSSSQLSNYSTNSSTNIEKPLNDDLEHTEIDHLYLNLEKIRSNFVDKIGKSGSIKCEEINTDRKSPESDFDRIELHNETPHLEIQQLHTVFDEMIEEVKSLKTTLINLQHKQSQKSVNTDTNVDKLAEEIELLKKSKNMNLKFINTRKYHNFRKPKSVPSKKSNKSVSNTGSGSSLGDIYGSTVTVPPRRSREKPETPNINIAKAKKSISIQSDHASEIIEFCEEILESISYEDFT